MFTTYFKMSTHPFSEDLPVERFLKDERLTQGLARLEYFAKEGRIALITGTTGVGKSSLIRLFVHHLSRHLFLPVYLYLTHVKTTGLLNLIVSALGEMPKRGKDRLFLQILEKTKKTEFTTLLIIDEAQLMEPASLTDLRLLVSSVLGEKPALKLLLSGQETLRHQLKQAARADFVNRICVRYHMPPLTKEQTVSYIDYQLRQAGASEKIFEPEAKDLIHDYAGGIPREVNNIATACLINAATRNLQKITDRLVNETMVEFQLP